MEKIYFEKENSIKIINNYKPEIDGLRALAVIAVLIYHFNKTIIPNGFLGVDIFFMISGYVITSSLSRNNKENFSNFLFGFYLRRIKRLLPSLIFFVVFNIFLISIVNPASGYSICGGIYALFGLSIIEFYSK